MKVYTMTRLVFVCENCKTEEGQLQKEWIGNWGQRPSWDKLTPPPGWGTQQCWKTIIVDRRQGHLMTEAGVMWLTLCPTCLALARAAWNKDDVAKKAMDDRRKEVGEEPY